MKKILLAIFLILSIAVFSQEVITFNPSQTATLDWEYEYPDLLPGEVVGFNVYYSDWILNGNIPIDQLELSNCILVGYTEETEIDILFPSLRTYWECAVEPVVTYANGEQSIYSESTAYTSVGEDCLSGIPFGFSLFLTIATLEKPTQLQGVITIE